MNKICKKCENNQDILEFTKRPSCKGGYSTVCKACIRKYSKLYHAKMKENIKYARTRTIYQKAHKKETNKRARDWYINNKEICNQRNIARRKQNPDIYKNYKAARRAREIQAMPIWANKNKIKQIYKEATDLSKQTNIIYEVDHIIPLKNDLVCGLHVEHNLQIITREANRSKSNRLEN